MATQVRNAGVVAYHSIARHQMKRSKSIQPVEKISLQGTKREGWSVTKKSGLWAREASESFGIATVDTVIKCWETTKPSWHEDILAHVAFIEFIERLLLDHILGYIFTCWKIWQVGLICPRPQRSLANRRSRGKVRVWCECEEKQQADWSR